MKKSTTKTKGKKTGTVNVKRMVGPLSVKDKQNIYELAIELSKTQLSVRADFPTIYHDAKMVYCLAHDKS